MTGAPRETWATLDIVRRDHGPDAASLRDELVALVERAMAAVRIGPATPSKASTLRVVLCLARPADHGRVDALLDALAAALDGRNSGLDLSEWLQVVATVHTREQAAASPLAARVLAAARTAALVVEASEAWHAAAGRRDPAYLHVRDEGATFWLRLPGRSAVPGLTPPDLVLGEPRERRRAPQSERTVITELLRAAFLDAPRPTLERIFRRTSAFQDPRQFSSRLRAVAGQVCQIRIGADAAGTGFLVGSDLVLTNHHVVARVIGGDVAPSAVQCVFDYIVGDNGTVGQGVPFGLHDGGDWLVAASPPSAADEHGDPTRLPTVDELDHALLRLAEPAGQTMSLDGRERGWLRLLGDIPEPTPGLPLLIMQHPDGRPVKLAMADTGVKAVNRNRTRLTYCVNTEAGSSGSPCLTFDLELVALHHSGQAHHNEGVPIATIVAHLDDAGRAALRGT